MDKTELQPHSEKPLGALTQLRLPKYQISLCPV